MGNTYEKKIVIDGGFDADFDSPLPEELTCCICFLAFRDPMQLSCGHQYCRSCLSKCSRKQGREFACPVDRHLVDVDKIFPDKAMERRVLSLGVKCGNSENGCEWSGELRALDKHTQECMYVLMDCTQCSMQILKSYIDEHTLHQCDYRVLSCGLCNIDYLFKDEHSHNETCQYWPVDCVNSCGNEIPRNEMDAHLRKCSSSTNSCLESNLSSSFVGIADHDDNWNLGEHDQFKLAMDKIHNLEKELVSTKEKNVYLEDEVNVQKELLDLHMKKSMTKEIDLQLRIETLEEEFAKITQLLTETLLNMEKEKSQQNIPSLYSAEPCSSQGSSSEHFSSQGSSSEHFISSQGSSSEPFSSQASSSEPFNMHKSLSTSTEECAPCVDIPGERLTVVAEAVRQMQESQYGILVWKVDRYKQQLVEAQHTHQYICSEPFFTSEHGYKLRLQTWLNGHGIGKGMCISLYVQIMKGPHDNDLVWPFSLKTSLLILNQFDAGMHRERSNDPSEAGDEIKQMYFGRPMSPVNVGYGCGTALITHKHAISNGFVVDDCIYLMCKIGQ